MNFKEAYEFWLNDLYFDEETKKELENIKENEKEIEDRFYKNLEFGTGGLRGIIGAGTNRINIYTVSKATQGFANYILAQPDFSKEKGVAIGYDSRYMSPEFAEITALVLNGNNIKTYLFDELRPTPMVSYAIRKLGCIGGVVITASHNPPEYNGYKVYGADGGQVPFPKDKEIIKFVDEITDFKMIKKANKEDAIKNGLFNIIGKEIDEAYDENVLGQLINKDAILKTADDLKIVYTPIHGTGNKPVRRILEKAGFKNVYIVKEQELPDCKFSTVGYPNPEDPKAFELALKLAKEVDADVIVGTDPDADRVGAIVKNKNGEYSILTGNMIGVMLTEYILSQRKEKGLLSSKDTIISTVVSIVKNKNGEYSILTGNMIGVMLTEYILSQRKEKGLLSSKDTIISTVVSTNMTEEITKAYNVNYINVLTGFKFIGEKIKEFEETGSNEFIFGFEESYGCLAGTYARDKDAVVSTMLICELASFCKEQGITLYENLENLYKKYGYFKDDIKSITLKGIEGIKDMEKIMSYLRKETPKEINGQKLISFSDYKASEKINILTGEKTKINLPSSNVLYFDLEDKSWFCVRPSGTEPKIKIYFGVKENNSEDMNKNLANLLNSVMQIIDNIFKKVFYYGKKFTTIYERFIIRS